VDELHHARSVPRNRARRPARRGRRTRLAAVNKFARSAGRAKPARINKSRTSRPAARPGGLRPFWPSARNRRIERVEKSLPPQSSRQGGSS
jgi:hypothetical protein